MRSTCKSFSYRIRYDFLSEDHVKLNSILAMVFGLYKSRPKNIFEIFFVFLIREKLQELNNELLKKNSYIDEMEPKYNASCEF